MAFDLEMQLSELGLGLVLRRAQAAVAHDFAERFTADDIRPAQYAVLAMLRQHPGSRQTELGDLLGIKRTNFVPLFDALEKRGLAERRRVPGDRRVAALFLTEAGAALLVRLDGLAAAHEARFTARLGGPQARATLIGLLHRLSEPGFDPP